MVALNYDAFLQFTTQESSFHSQEKFSWQGWGDFGLSSIGHYTTLTADFSEAVTSMSQVSILDCYKGFYRNQF